MAHLAGNAGNVLAAATATGIKSWSLDYTAITAETTDFADAGVKSFVFCGSEWSGSFEGYKDGAPLALSTVPITVQLKESATAGQIWTGSALITGIHDSVSFDGAVTYSYDFLGSGALTVATA